MGEQRNLYALLVVSVENIGDFSDDDSNQRTANPVLRANGQGDTGRPENTDTENRQGWSGNGLLYPLEW
jgi:hypothetical protein